ncbi:conserved hypothetical protein [Hyphomicrobiales bacterium]|nr:conserved hypothetical protein [Hyphomicrobiales bacterium]CAH1699889.1 conserved hypothetical protein [Hyphomicrobiales bacterium]CAI0343619.1 conserved hypothetical protein [Hyphomicrobiales bacterium]
MRTLVKVIELKVLSHPRLWLRFSDGSAGVRDLSDVLAEGGPMVEPLRDAKLFARAFVQSGVPTWPNGFDLDAIALHDEMGAAGLLGPAQAA